MTVQFTAVFEDGCLRPTAPVSLPEGVAVEVFVITPEGAPPSGSSAEILARIAALPSQPVDPATSVRHDEVLYGREVHP